MPVSSPVYLVEARFEGRRRSRAAMRGPPRRQHAPSRSAKQTGCRDGRTGGPGGSRRRPAPDAPDAPSPNYTALQHNTDATHRRKHAKWRQPDWRGQPLLREIAVDTLISRPDGLMAGEHTGRADVVKVDALRIVGGVVYRRADNWRVSWRCPSCRHRAQPMPRLHRVAAAKDRRLYGTPASAAALLAKDAGPRTDNHRRRRHRNLH